MSETDLELLARYTRQNAEDAFAEIVRRHLNLVYSAALRQVRSPQLAEEIAQSVFLKLARHASELAPSTVLGAWLYQVTRREAVDVVRREASRQLREQIALEMTAMNAPAADWIQIEPWLDEAMHALDETDRTAVLLRYFEGRSLREVGSVLGASEDAAQKRVSRAVERLREFFVGRGIAVGVSTLTLIVSANAVQAAPSGLAATISTAVAGTTVLAMTAITTKTILMTTLQKVITAAAILVLTAGGTMFVHYHVLPYSRASSRPAADTDATTFPTEFPQASWKFVGYADPESAYLSFMWAMSQGDVERTHGSLTPTARARWESNGRPRPPGEKDERLAQRVKQTELFRILARLNISETETHLQIQSVGATNEDLVQEQWARMIKVGDNWKFEGWAQN